MRLGVLLPTFRASPAEALAAAHEAAALGLDGVFAYDHLYPMGQPERPALAPFGVLAAVAVREPSLVVGPLVARVGLVDNAVLLSQCRALRLAAGGRAILGIGTGDHLSKEENAAFGIAYAAAGERRAWLEAIARALHDEGGDVWIGDGAAATREVATAVGCTLNLWDRPPEAVAALAARGQVSWAGPAPQANGTVDERATVALVEALATAGATWAVFAPQTPLALVARCRAALAP